MIDISISNLSKEFEMEISNIFLLLLSVVI